jgi:hypothetical protein
MRAIGENQVENMSFLHENKKNLLFLKEMLSNIWAEARNISNADKVGLL